MECVKIDQRFQHQPETDEDWAPLRLGVSMMEKLPSLKTEANWLKNIEIPPLFNFQAALSSNEGVYNETSQDSLENCDFEVS